ncbi:hypothetical protein LXL04_030334 [Taraxacum kok-saghyz]
MDMYCIQKQKSTSPHTAIAPTSSSPVAASRRSQPHPPQPHTAFHQSLYSPSMEGLPAEFVVNILSRLAVKKIIHCKCVCKKWLGLISHSYFDNLRLSRSPPTLLIHHNSVGYDRNSNQPGILTWVEVEDDLDHHHLHHDPLMNLNLNLSPIFQESSTLLLGSVDGMVYLWQEHKDNSYICNPISREYMILPPPPKTYYHQKGLGPPTIIITSCFGVGSVTKKYKVIRIAQQLNPLRLSEAEVYTLGTHGQWRSPSPGNVPYWLGGGHHGTFLNGHAHWIIFDKYSSEKKIYVFDFDNEIFKLFPSPPIGDIEDSQISHKSLAVLKGCLCQSNANSGSLDFTFWVMKEYGIKESWHKELVINENIDRYLGGVSWQPIHPIEHLRDGTILMVRFGEREYLFSCDGTVLMVRSGEKLFVYSSEGGTIADTDYGFDHCFTAVAYRPSFLKLRNFESERVYVL